MPPFCEFPFATLNGVEHLARAAFPPEVDVRSTGETILTNRAADYMAVNELTSFTLTFVAIAIVHSVLFMSVKIGLLSLVPDLIPVVMVYGLMSLLGVPLNTGTALVATIAIGISVDDTVHHLMTYARTLDTCARPSLALFATLRTVGRAIVASSLALAAGSSSCWDRDSFPCSSSACLRRSRCSSRSGRSCS